MLYNKVFERIVKNKERKKSGEYLNIPYPYPRLNEHLCGIDKGQAIAVLAATGSGKSKWVRYTFIYNVYKFYKETGYKVKILYFCMEDAKEAVYDLVFCNYLKEYHNITVTNKELHSKTRELPDFIIQKLAEAKEYFEEFEQVVNFIDGETEPTRIFELCKKIASNTGKTYSWYENIEGEDVKQYKYESDLHVVAIFDNMSNLDEEEGVNGEQAAILKFVKDYMRAKLCNFFGWSCVMVMQLDFESERQSFTKGGETIVSKLEPNLSSVGDSKRSTRSFHLIFSMFSPHRYDLISYPVPSKADPDNYYRIDILGNKFRSLRVIKANGSDVGMRIGMLFDAIGETFEELPSPKDPEMKLIYNKFGGNKTVMVKSKNTTIFEETGEVLDEAPF